MPWRRAGARIVTVAVACQGPVRCGLISHRPHGSHCVVASCYSPRMDDDEIERLRKFAFGPAPEWERANATLKHRVRELEALLPERTVVAAELHRPPHGGYPGEMLVCCDCQGGALVPGNTCGRCAPIQTYVGVGF